MRKLAGVGEHTALGKPDLGTRVTLSSPNWRDHAECVTESGLAAGVGGKSENLTIYSRRPEKVEDG